MAEIRASRDDDSESFYSAQDIDDLPENTDDDSDSFYSAEDLSVDQEDELFVDSALMHDADGRSEDRTFIDMDSLQGDSDYPVGHRDKIGEKLEYSAQKEEFYDVFNHESYSAGNERSPSKEVFVLESRSPGVLTLEIESSSDSDIYDERVKARPNRSPSLKILSCKEEDASVLTNGTGLWDEEITVPDTASGGSDAVVEFDGARQVIVIASEGEEGLEEATRKRPQSAQSDEAPIAGHMQSPYQKKMRKLREIADRANGVQEVPMRAIDLR